MNKCLLNRISTHPRKQKKSIKNFLDIGTEPPRVYMTDMGMALSSNK
jgi:hypothetical protein